MDTSACLSPGAALPFLSWWIKSYLKLRWSHPLREAHASCAGGRIRKHEANSLLNYAGFKIHPAGGLPACMPTAVAAPD